MPRHTKSEVGQGRALLLHELMDGRSGAAIVLLDLLRYGGRSLGEPVGKEVEWCLTELSTIGVCGDDLYVLWWDVCHHSVGEMLSLLRACRDGCDGISCDTIRQAIAYYKQGAAPLEELQLVSEVPAL